MRYKHSFQEESDKAGMYEVTGFIMHETGKALLFDDGTGRTFWLPRKLIRIEEGRRGTWHVFLPEWLTAEKGLA